MTCQTPRCAAPARVALATDGTRAVVHLDLDDAPASARRACATHALELVPAMLALMMTVDDTPDTLADVLPFPGTHRPVKSTA